MSQKCSERAWLKGQAGENTRLLNKSFVRGVIITANRPVQRRRGWEDRHRIRSALMSLALQANVGYSCETTCTAKGCLLAWYCSDDKFLSLSWSWFALLARVFLPHGLHGLGGKKSGCEYRCDAPQAHGQRLPLRAWRSSAPTCRARPAEPGCVIMHRSSADTSFSSAS